MILNWERPTKHRYVALIGGIPVASAQSRDAAWVYLMLAVQSGFPAAGFDARDVMPAVVERSELGRA